jgi:UDP-N-acetylglucosamine 4-epimerase
MEIFNVASGGRITLLELFEALRVNLTVYDPEIAKVDVSMGPKREGDIPHSFASAEKITAFLGYSPKFNAFKGFHAACKWYFDNMNMQSI